jgi:RHS repeat-associated protein
VSTKDGHEYERVEYTPYGELWIEQRAEGMGQDGGTPFRFTGKDLDAETGFYYYGARYLNPKTGIWISADPAMGDYIPKAPVDEEARKRNGNLPGMGGVFNYVNMHVYHYAGNNPIKYIDPDGRDINPIKGGKTTSGYQVTSSYGAIYNNNPHTGIDFVSTDHDIVATQKGKVIFAGKHPDGTSTATGTLIIIKYSDGKYGLYGHLDDSTLKVAAGDDVEEGTELGKYYTAGDGKMGVSSGAHLHYGRYELDDDKKDDKYSDVKDFVRLFNATGYFYGKSAVPTDKKIKDGVYSVEPGFDK